MIARPGDDSAVTFVDVRTLAEPMADQPDRGGSFVRGGASGRIAVVFQSGKSGSAALREAAKLARSGCELHVVTLAPQAERAKCCRSQCEGPYNIAVKEEAVLELDEARSILGSVAEEATFEVLEGSPEPPFAHWVAENGFGLVVLPRARLTLGGSPFARSLRKTQADVRLVSG